MSPEAAHLFMTQLSGRDESVIDEKGRIVLKERIRERLGSPFVLAYSDMGCLVAYPLDSWAAEIGAIQEARLHNPGRRTLLRLLQGSAETDLKFDGQNRLLIPRHMRDYAGLRERTKAVAVGCGDRLELWNKDEFERWEADPGGYGSARRAVWEDAYRQLVEAP